MENIDYKKLYFEQKEERERLDLFLAMVRHEIPGYLMGIMGLAEFIKDGTITPEEAPQYAEMIHQNGEKINKITKLIHLAGKIGNKEKINLEELLIRNSNLKRMELEKYDRSTKICHPGKTKIYANEAIVETLHSTIFGNALSRASPNSTIYQAIDLDEKNLILRMENHHQGKKLYENGLNQGYGTKFLESILNLIGGSYKTYVGNSKLSENYKNELIIGKNEEKYIPKKEDQLYGIEISVPKTLKL